MTGPVVGDSDTSPVPPPEVAYYYPEWHWAPDEHSWIKTLLLFFDQIALLVPDYKRDEPANIDPEVAGALQDAGLLLTIEPESFVDAEMTQSLAATMVEIIAAGAFDDLARHDRYAELSMSRAGYYGERQVAKEVVAMLRERDLARETQDGVSIPMHPSVRSTYLVLLAQLARRGGERRGLDLHPATNRPEARDVLTRTLGLSPMPSRGRVVEFDLETVAVDLELVPLDELLDFRTEHRTQHRLYMSNLRKFCRELSSIESEADRARLLSDRREELQEAAQELRQRSWNAFRRPTSATSFALGLVGAAVGLAAGGAPVAAAAGISSQLVRLLPEKAPDSIYSYLFSAQRELG